MRPKILFVVMSAVARPDTVAQLAQALAPHQVLIHHDFSQTPEFKVAADNVCFVPDPCRTGWASFGFVDGIFHSLAHAVEHLDFDYLQLLSPTCLPTRPLEEFEDKVSGEADAHFGAIDLLADRDCLMSAGYRAFTAQGSWWHRALRRLSRDYFDGSLERREEAGVWLRTGGGKSLEAFIARCVVTVFSRAWIGNHALQQELRPYYGSVWFGARRAVVQRLVEGFRRPGVREYFSRLHISEEFLVPTLLMRVARRKGPLLHYISRFDGAHPQPLQEGQLDLVRASGAYFARKFPDDPAAPVRLQVLRELLVTGRPQRSAAPATPDVVPNTTEVPESAWERAAQPVAALGTAAVQGLRQGWQSFAGAGRRPLRH